METTEISIVDPAGSPIRTLSDTPTSDSEPRWSPDGRRLAVSAYGGPGNDDVALIDPATGRFRRLTTSPSYEHSPAWSPDGRRIAYVKDGAIHVMGRDGTADRAVTRGARTPPRLVPRRPRLTFVRDGNLFITRPDGSGAACVRIGMLLTSGARWRPRHEPVAGRGPAGWSPGWGPGARVPAPRATGLGPLPPPRRPAGACAPTRGRPAQGTRTVARGRAVDGAAGAGGEVERTAETVAAGRGGQRLVVEGTVYAEDCPTPLAGASIEVWQTNAAGEYGPGQGTSDERCCYLAAALRTDQRGRYRFETVKPGHYKGEERPPPAHIHFEVRHPEAAGVLTELLFEGDPWLGPGPPGAVVRPAGPRVGPAGDGGPLRHRAPPLAPGRTNSLSRAAGCRSGLQT